MNSWNILSSRVIGQTPPNSPSQLRQRSFSEGNLTTDIPSIQPRRSASQHVQSGASIDSTEDRRSLDESGGRVNLEAVGEEINEKTPFLRDDSKLSADSNPSKDRIRSVTKRLINALAEALRFLLSALAAPGVYALRCFYDEQGVFSPLMPMRRLGRLIPTRTGYKSIPQPTNPSGSPDQSEVISPENRSGRRKSTTRPIRQKLQAKESFSSATSDSDVDAGIRGESNDERVHGQQISRTHITTDDPTTTRRSIRIKTYNENTNRRKKERRTEDSPSSGSAWITDNKPPPLTAATLKSPTSPASSSLRMAKYPRALAPPRPLIPRRQPSYSSPHSSRSSSRLAQKTLVIDLDETLIHSLAKGGRMSSGHMVEVKLNTNAVSGGTTLGPQHPILYYVHKRPHCDDFLRNVCKWYNLVVFTASVQEYADPVIDWLEQERKYFSGRYYRQHCTYRNGAYIKDLSSVEPDLSKVMILDNSPLSYIFHQGMARIQIFYKVLTLVHRQCFADRRLDQRSYR